MELTEEVVILENSRLVIWSWFYENGERGGRGSPRLKWLALFQKKDDGRGSGRAGPEEALYFHSDSKRWIFPHLRDQ